MSDIKESCFEPCDKSVMCRKMAPRCVLSSCHLIQNMPGLATADSFSFLLSAPTNTFNEFGFFKAHSKNLTKINKGDFFLFIYLFYS